MASNTPRSNFSRRCDCLAQFFSRDALGDGFDLLELWANLFILMRMWIDVDACDVSKYITSGID
jgi:hypothetical protein